MNARMRRSPSVQVVSLALLHVSLAGCGESPPVIPPEPTLQNGAEFVLAPVYEAVTYPLNFGQSRQWFPVDLAVHPGGELWVVQRMERDPDYDDETECTTRGIAGSPNDCVSLQGSTVAITDPAAAEPATADNGRARLVVDTNSWHFMRRPSSIAFGNPALPFTMDDPGAIEAGVTDPLVYTNTFATCHEHWTGNATDDAPFIGPTLWTADPVIYDGTMGSFEWSNGTHLDMVHATPYCMGVAYEGGNAYWTFNGVEGTLDRYDFGAPHFEGHYDHGDATVHRHSVGSVALSRVPYVPSNMVFGGSMLFVADTGNGRVLAIDTSTAATETGVFSTYEGLAASLMSGHEVRVVADRAALEAEWGGTAEPSGLAVFDSETLAIASHATGHITLLGLDGMPIRTLDTGTGVGIGGLTVMNGSIYFVQMRERRVYRIDVVDPAAMP